MEDRKYSINKLYAKCIRMDYSRFLTKFSKDLRKVESELLDRYKYKYVTEVKLLLSYSATAIDKNSNTLLHSRSRHSFDKKKVSYKRFIDLLNMMQEDGYIDLSIGYAYYDKYLKVLTEYEPSFIILLPKLIDMIKPNKSDVVKPVKTGLIVVNKNTDASKIDVKLKRELEDSLMEYNDFLSDKNFTVEVDGERVGVASLVYKRSFTNDLDHGGRYYDITGFMSTMPVKMRKTIEIDGEPVCELDYSQLHPSILYDIKGVNLPDGFDLYGIDQEAIDQVVELDYDAIEEYRKATGDYKFDPVRNLLKKCVLVMLNTRDKREATMAVYGDYNDEKNKLWNKWINSERDTLKYYGIENLLSVVAIFNELEYKHESIKNHFYDQIGLSLQNIDSSIASYIIEYFSRNNEVVLSMHDSFIIKRSQEDSLREIMFEAYKAVVGSNFNCKVVKEY